MDVRSRGLRETSPDRAKVCLRPRVKPIKKVQVVYYLSRNGHLEHPHYMEVSHLADQPLRLRDVMERLTILRGKGMPSLYSWSCKRSYKNGYVWNDLAENDIIYPTDGAEYVLKGSELVEGCSEKLQQIHISSARRQQQEDGQELNFRPTQKPKYDYDEEEDEEQEQEQEEDYELDEDQKTSYTSSTTPKSRCSRGVSTDELEEAQAQQAQTQQFQAQNTPSEPTTSLNHSDDSPSMITANKNRAKQSNNRSRRFNDDDPGVVLESGSGQGRNSVLLQLIACGSSAVAKAKSTSAVSAKNSNGNGNRNGNGNESGSFLRKGVLCKSAAKMADEEMIDYMSENPRFGNPQAEEKEYFSGSIVESMTEGRAGNVTPVLKKSTSYNEERSAKAGLEEITVAEVKREKAKMTGKCIPRKRSSTSSKQESKK